MAKVVIDLFETVEVDKHQGKTGVVALGQMHCVLQTIAKQNAVGNIGQGVVVGETGEVLLGLFALDGIAQRALQQQVIDLAFN